MKYYIIRHPDDNGWTWRRVPGKWFDRHPSYYHYMRKPYPTAPAAMIALRNKGVSAQDIYWVLKGADSL